MKIVRLNIPSKEMKDAGLQEIKMQNLGNIVLIAGPNGSGKTRLLNKIETLVKFKLSEEKIEKLKKDNSNLERALGKTDSSIDRNTYKKNIELNLTNIEKSNYFDVSEEIKDNIYAIRFVPKSLNLADCNDVTPKVMLEKSNAIDNIGIDKIHDSAISKIQVLQNRYFESTHPKSILNSYEKAHNINEYERLNILIKNFLNTTIGRDKDGHATLFGFKIGECRLSDGQKILLQFCMAIFAQKNKLNNLIILLDEPENHLHPLAIKEMINSLMDIVPKQKVQIWIATHSIPLLSQFSLNHLWYMENGNISFAGRNPEKVLEGLVGNDADYLKLQSFLMPSNDFALINYSIECLFPPVVSNSIHDDQSNQIFNAIVEKSKNLQRPIRILDFGAGKGRILESIFEIFKKFNLEFTEHIEYYAYDISTENSVECKKRIEECSKNMKSEKRYFNEINELKKTFPEPFFDIVIICNVLHEIHPQNWENIFVGNLGLYNLIAPSGELLLLEDLQLPVGELPHTDGFIVLNAEAIKKVFNVNNENDIRIFDQRNDGRLLAYLIKQHLLQNVTKETIIEGVEEMEKTASKKIMNIRNEPISTYKKGISHAFWTQQMVNAIFMLKKLKNIQIR